jgi:hypothetical protein
LLYLLSPLRNLFGLVGVLAGFLLALGVLGGDEAGRVNLLYALCLFAFLPVLSLLFSLLVVFGRSGGLTGMLLAMPYWPSRWRRELNKVARQGNLNVLVFQLGQVLALGFAAGNLFGLFIMLLGTDVNFIWRSTILTTGDLLPVLEVIAYPWQFWPSAQPDAVLLAQTQDFRLRDLPAVAGTPGLWWRYIFAAQVCYSVIPRTLMLVIAQMMVVRKTQNAPASLRATGDEPLVRPPVLAEVVASLDTPYELVNWASAPDFCTDYISELFGEPSAHLTPTSGTADLSSLSRPVVIVKSWEPPMGELKDVLLSGTGYLLPLDWEAQKLRDSTSHHQQEWQRFCATLPGWKILQVNAP